MENIQAAGMGEKKLKPQKTTPALELKNIKNR